MNNFLCVYWANCCYFCAKIWNGTFNGKIQMREKETWILNHRNKDYKYLVHPVDNLAPQGSEQLFHSNKSSYQKRLLMISLYRDKHRFGHDYSYNSLLIWGTVYISVKDQTSKVYGLFPSTPRVLRKCIPFQNPHVLCWFSMKTGANLPDISLSKIKLQSWHCNIWGEPQTQL